MQMNLFTPIEEVISPIKECDQILVALANNQPCPKV
jgi:hypothetical protein